ncbi:uncharacterized protein LOC134291634 [Aedes albopictus]|uniref:Retroviral polymerase SH3-like domain-containing protein n=1 Tax=Aedes albopictus TaxID=7160 RepID=A0ABM1YBZ6_AEDAL
MSKKRAKAITPHETVYGLKPDLSAMHVFGVKAYVHIPKEQRIKLKPEAKKMTFVGYSLQHKGYRRIDSKTNKIKISRDVRFLSEDEPGMFVSSEEDTVEYEFRNSDVQDGIEQQFENPVDDNEDQEVLSAVGSVSSGRLLSKTNWALTMKMEPGS